MQGELFSHTLGGKEVGSGEIVIDPERRIFNGLKDGVTQGPAGEDHGPTNCTVKFAADDVSYSATKHCSAAFRGRSVSGVGITDERWRIDRATGHLDFDLQLSPIDFPKTAECSPMGGPHRF